jgi:Omp85 superfamily domain
MTARSHRLLGLALVLALGSGSRGLAETAKKTGGGMARIAPAVAPSSSQGPGFDLAPPLPAGGEPAVSENEWVAAPVPFINPLLGLGLAGGVAYIYHPPDADKALPPWMTGVGMFYSENKSWGVVLGHRMNLRQDTWRILGLLGYGEINYDFYGIGDEAGKNDQAVSLAQTAKGGTVEGLIRMREHFYGGLNYTGSQVTTRITDTGLPPWINDIITGGQLKSTLSTPALRLQWDSRDDTFLPAAGWLIDGELAVSDEAFGSDFNYQALTLTVKHYWRLSERQTMAAYGYGRFAFGDIPFFSLSMIGAKGNLRGYAVGRYQDNMAMTGQVEYRWQAWRKFGMVAFAGVGAVAPDLNGFTSATALPSFGGGLRYQLTDQNKVNFRLDVAWGRDDVLYYLSVGEAF